MCCSAPNGGVPDCAGYCGGRAARDDCGDCAGGLSGVARNLARDCDGVCHGNHTDCPAPTPRPSEPPRSVRRKTDVRVTTAEGDLAAV
jgi:hypothetical protein